MNYLSENIIALQFAVFVLPQIEKVMRQYEEASMAGEASKKLEVLGRSYKRELKKLKAYILENPQLLNQIPLIGLRFPVAAEYMKAIEEILIEEYEDYFKIDKKKKERARAKAQRIKAKHCLICGQKNIHRHHYDYGKPIDIFQLCPAHHLRLHAKMRKEKKWYTKKETQNYINANLLNLLEEPSLNKLLLNRAK